MANYVSYNDLEPIVTKIGNKFKALEGAYVIKGSKTFAQLPALNEITANMVGFVYNISTDFTLDNRFVEYDANVTKSYSAGTNVVIVDNGDGVNNDFKLDVVSAFVDVAALNGLINGVSDMITADEYDNEASYAIGDVVKKDGVLYKFKAALAPEEPATTTTWDASKVDAVTIMDLINAAEPGALTTSEKNTLLGLLD